ncbi:MAG: transglutaminase family protein [Rhodospirillales bacterium]|nr:transglutaminase family protein [Rhodospirillales bacterium]
MRFDVTHTTRFTFAEPCGYSIHQCRLTPRVGQTQRLLNWEIRTPGKGRDWTDGYGNMVRSFSLVEPHDTIEISARGVFEWVEGGPPYLAFGEAEALPPVYWLRNHGLAAHEATIETFVDDLRPRAADSADRMDLLHALVQRIAGRMEYRVGATTVEASAAEALARGAGVSQDFAHLFVACCRALGIPARYASGCVNKDKLAHVSRLGHAWAEVHVSDLGWVGFDPANGVRATGEYLKLGIGLDYAEAAPVTGRRFGGGEAAMEVDVSVDRIG